MHRHRRARRLRACHDASRRTADQSGQRRADVKIEGLNPGQERRMNKQILTALCLGTALLALPGTGAVAQTPALMALSKAPTSVYALTAKHELIRFDPAEPDKVLERVQVTGLADGDALRGIDYRVAHGVMYALGASGRLYTVDPKSGELTRVGDGELPLELPEGPLGFDFNPAADRIRVVAETGLNLRLHPETG